MDTIKYVVSPGPANYKPHVDHTKTTFNYSMPGRPNSANTAKTPGPGNYELRLSLEHSSYKFGNSQKLIGDSSTVKGNPGPGTYHTRKDLGKDGVPKYR